MTKTPENMKTITVNGTVLWSRFGSRMVFARQLEPTAGLYKDNDLGLTQLSTNQSRFRLETTFNCVSPMTMAHLLRPSWWVATVKKAKS